MQGCILEWLSCKEWNEAMTRKVRGAVTVVGWRGLLTGMGWVTTILFLNLGDSYKCFCLVIISQAIYLFYVAFCVYFLYNKKLKKIVGVDRRTPSRGRGRIPALGIPVLAPLPAQRCWAGLSHSISGTQFPSLSVEGNESCLLTRLVGEPSGTMGWGWRGTSSCHFRRSRWWRTFTEQWLWPHVILTAALWLAGV